MSHDAAESIDQLAIAIARVRGRTDSDDRAGGMRTVGDQTIRQRSIRQRSILQRSAETDVAQPNEFVGDDFVDHTDRLEEVRVSNREVRASVGLPGGGGPGNMPDPYYNPGI